MLRIWPIGDSITEGTAGGGSYRSWLGQMLHERGYVHEFIGSRCSEPDPAEPRTTKLQHDGHSGWMAQEFVHGPGGWDESHGNLERWVHCYTPDLVLLHVGTNDFLGSHSPDEILGAIKEILEVIRRHHPRAELFVAKIIPPDNDALNYGLYAGLTEPTTFAAALNEIHARLDREDLGPRVTVVDVGKNWDPRADLIDGIHPSLSGSRKIAAAWLDAIEAMFRP